MVTTEIDTIYEYGLPVTMPGIQVAGKRFVVEGRFVATARLNDEWYEDIGDPEAVIRSLKECTFRPDILTFWQRLPDLVPTYAYYHEMVSLSAIPLTTFQNWWEKQIDTDTRKKAKRPGKRGVEIKAVPLTDDFVRGVMEIYNETPVRRGKRFWHYGHDFETVKRGLSRDLVISKFIGAYEAESLLGFIKLVFAEGRFANPGLIVSKLEARKKYVNNGLIAKAVELCAAESIPYLIYTNWRRGSQAEFLIRHGFEKREVPRYWVPLTQKGKIAIKAGLHRNIRAYLPEPIIASLLTLREAFYNRRYKIADNGAARTSNDSGH